MINTFSSHDNSYDNATHSQPNAQFSSDGKYIIYETDYMGAKILTCF